MSITKERKEEVIKNFRLHDKDFGSTQIQVAILTERIRELTKHFRTHKKDHHSRHGLLKLTGRRRSLLEYLKRKDLNEYRDLLQKLKLRK